MRGSRAGGWMRGCMRAGYGAQGRIGFAWARGGVVAVTGLSVSAQRPLWGPAVCVTVLWGTARHIGPLPQVGRISWNQQQKKPTLDGWRTSQSVRRQDGT